MSEPSQNTLIITGGSKGIGHAACELFLEKGWRVINLSRTASSLPEVEQLQMDLGDPAWPGQHGEALLQKIDTPARLCLIHNAGLMLKDSSTTVSTEGLQRSLQINVVSPTQLTRLLVPVMSPGSSVIYVSSTLGEKAVANTCSYVISKHAMVGAMRAACQDFAGTGIHTACVCPGFTDTEMLRAHLGNDQGILDSIAGGVTFGRLIEAREIADTLWFCAENPVINGAVIHANLGQIEH